MELRHLRYFVAVAEECHITRAAQRLGIQQPPLSLQIKALERELGVPLFVRSARGVTLTVAGEAFLEDALAILDQVGKAAARSVRVSLGHVGRLSIGFTTSAALHPMVPGIIRAFRVRYARVDLDLRENAAADLTEAVLRGDIQAALIRAPVARPPGLAFAELAHEELLAVLPRGHKLLSARLVNGVDLLDLAVERFILVRRPGAPGIYENVILACRAAGFEPDVAAEVPHMLTNINLVAAGVGISLVPASMREVNLQQVGYQRIRSEPKLTAPLTLVWQEGSADPLLENLISIARALAEAPTEGRKVNVLPRGRRHLA
jgi:DNA-binding transcriptional LysR family regulator